MSVKTASCRHCRTPERIASLHYLMAKSFDETIDRLADQLAGSSEAFDRQLEESRAEHQRQDSLGRLNTRRALWQSVLYGHNDHRSMQQVRQHGGLRGVAGEHTMGRQSNLPVLFAR